MDFAICRVLEPVPRDTTGQLYMIYLNMIKEKCSDTIVLMKHNICMCLHMRSNHWKLGINVLNWLMNVYRYSCKVSIPDRW